MSDQPFGIEDNQESDVLFVFEDEFGNVTEAPEIDSGSITATSSDTTAITVTVNSDESGITATADGAVDSAVTVSVAFTVDGTPWAGSEVFNVGASAPTQLVLAPQTPNPVTPITPSPMPEAAVRVATASAEGQKLAREKQAGEDNEKSDRHKKASTKS